MQAIRGVFFKNINKLSDWFFRVAKEEVGDLPCSPNHKAIITKELIISRDAFKSFTANFNSPYNFFEDQLDGRGFDHCLEVKMDSFYPDSILLVIDEDGTKYVGVRQIYFQERPRVINGGKRR